jgi:hypothetical protein
MKIHFNGWFSGFLNKENPGVTVDFFLELFKKVYNEDCEVGNIDESDVLCEFDMLIDCPGTFVQAKKWKTTYLFNGESTMRCNKNLYDVVLWGERNHQNVVNVPLFVPYIYTNNFVDRLSQKTNVTRIPDKNICVIITNPRGIVRNTFLNELEKFIKIDYAGNYKNNIGACIKDPYNTEEFLNFISQYKFVISMENSKEDTYITEKIIHGLLANTIPIYWGSNRVFDYFNEKRIINLNSIDNIDNTIKKILNILNDNNEWISIVNENNFYNNELNRNIDVIAQDIRCLNNKKCWNHINKVYCINNDIFEPDRHKMLNNMFLKHNISNDFIKYICPTYKHTIDQNTYNKYTSNQLVRFLRGSNMSYGELSLFLNYRAVLEDIEKNYKDGLFLIFESDVMESKEISKFNKFLDFIKDRDFDIIHLGLCDHNVFNVSLTNSFITGYRLTNEKFNNDIIEYEKQFTSSKKYIEDITSETDEFRVIRKFYTRCTDSFLWKYDGIVKFLNFMRNFEDYSAPFDYYMCNCFEKNINIKHYWTVNEFFIQGSNHGLIPSTLR